VKAAVLTDDKKIVAREVPVPQPGDEEVLIKVHWASICGTDIHIYLGEFKDRVTYPRILGHEFSGVVVSAGKSVANLKEGDRVVVDPIIWCSRCPACLNGQNNVCSNLGLIGIETDGAFAEYTVADSSKVFKLPDNISTRDGSLVELYSLGVHSARKALIEPGDRVVILGAGRLGLSVLEVIKQTAASWVCSVDIQDYRLEIAGKMGADLTINNRRKDPVVEVMSLTDGLGVDRVIETVGAAEEIEDRELPVSQAVRMTRSGGRIVVMGLGPQFTPVFWKEFVLKEIQLVGSRVTLGDFPRALSMMSQGIFHPDLLVTKEFGLEETAEAFHLLEERPDSYLKVLIKIA